MCEVLARTVTSKLGRQADTPFESAAVSVFEAAYVPLSACSESEKMSHGDVSTREQLSVRLHRYTGLHRAFLMSMEPSVPCKETSPKASSSRTHQYSVKRRVYAESYNS